MFVLFCLLRTSFLGDGFISSEFFLGRKSEVHTNHQPVLCSETSPTYIAEIESKQRVRVKLGSGKVQQEHDTAMCFTLIEK